jgi:hypothetical protein
VVSRRLRSLCVDIKRLWLSRVGEIASALRLPRLSTLSITKDTMISDKDGEREQLQEIGRKL